LKISLNWLKKYIDLTDIDVEEILKDYPRLTKEDIQAAIMYAESLVENTEIFPLQTA